MILSRLLSLVLICCWFNVEACGWQETLPLASSSESLITAWQDQDQESEKPAEKPTGKPQATTDDGSEPAQNPSDTAEAENEESRSTRKARRGPRSFSKRSQDFISVFSSAVGSTSGAVVVISDGKDQIALGTMVDANGLILTKSSELRGEIECRLANGKTLKPSIVGIDPDTDLALLQVNADELNFARLEAYPQPDVGMWLATVNQDDKPLTVGIVSHAAREIPDVKLNSAVMGIFPEDREQQDGVRINRVVNDSPAEQAGLLVNDVIVSIDEEPILTREELMEKLSHYQPGDEIVLKIRRGDEESDVPLTLGKRSVNPMMDRGSRQNRMGSKLSRRHANFPLAIQHDSVLDANQVGGPVVDLDGRVVGVNIARSGRVSSLALPNEVILPVISKLRTGKYPPAIVFKREIQRIQKKLAKLTDEMSGLPEKKVQKEIEFSAGSAVEKELELQIQETEQKLSALKTRRDETKKENQSILKSLTEIESEKKRIERKREPLEKELQQLTTGVRIR